jgi:hypothetical protein
MNPEARNSHLSAAMAAARRLLIHAMDLRFDLDEAGEALSTDRDLEPGALHRLRQAAAAAQYEIECLAELLLPDRGEDEETLEEGEASTAASFSL